MTRTRGIGRRPAGLMALCAALTALAAVVGLAAPPGSNVAALPVDVTFGDPLPGLTAAERSRFHTGKIAFEENKGVGDGIGPVFNDVSCAACHNGPTTGGGNAVLSTRIGAIVDGRFDPLVRFGGPTIQRSGIVGLNGFQFLGEVVPPEATIVAHRRAPAIFGLGLVDAVPDEALYALALYQSVAHPETAGLPNQVPDLRTGQSVVGRFGWKAGLGSLFDFAADASKDELGITVAGFIRTADGRTIGEENAPQGQTALLVNNPVSSPNQAIVANVDWFNDFMSFLAPPPRGPITKAARAGEAVFHDIGCADCHVPTWRTGRNNVRALDQVTFHPYSDFLLHDMGPLGDGIEQGTGRGQEMRTPPLWGLRLQPVLLHDGRADTVEQAILMHDGQGRPARDRFINLPAAGKQRLVAFLKSL